MHRTTASYDTESSTFSFWDFSAPKHYHQHRPLLLCLFQQFALRISTLWTFFRQRRWKQFCQMSSTLLLALCRANYRFFASLDCRIVVARCLSIVSCNVTCPLSGRTAKLLFGFRVFQGSFHGAKRSVDSLEHLCAGLLSRNLRTR